MEIFDVSSDAGPAIDQRPVIRLNAKLPPGTHDRARLADWFRCWGKSIRTWVAGNSAVSAADVDDLTQQVFVKLLRYSDPILVENPQGYLFRVATNVVTEWRARCRERWPHDDTWLEDLLIEAGDEPENVVAKARESALVRAAVERLPERQRQILIAHVSEELTYKEIAQRQGLTYRIVLRDLTRAYASLRDQLLADDL